MREYISIFVNGQHHQVRGSDAFLTLSDYLRNRLKLVGTKIVCSEGDCGSCSVLCGRVDESTASTLQYLPIDSCIRFVFQLDGCHIVTVEGLGGESNLSGVQKAMVDCHGSQCGFCTPGFVVAMTGLLEDNEAPTTEDWRYGLTGNLCRCTGYSPIIEAGQCASQNRSPKLNELFPPQAMVDSATDLSDDEIKIESAGGCEGKPRVLFCPTSIESATQFLAEHPQAKVIAGATDVGVQFNKGFAAPEIWLDLNRVKQLEQLSVNDGQVVAGARTTWSDLENLFQKVSPPFHQVISVFGSPQIRNVGTIGGNLINASPIADSIPFLMVCGAELELASVTETRIVNINDFYLGYKKLDLRPGELLTKILIPIPNSEEELRLYKVSRRRDMDISSFTAAIRIRRTVEEIESAAIALGAVGPVVLRLPKTEQFLIGKPFALDTMKSAGEIAVKEITPISDVRGGKDYRLQLAKNVLVKFFYESQTAGVTA